MRRNWFVLEIVVSALSLLASSPVTAVSILTTTVTATILSGGTSYAFETDQSEPSGHVSAEAAGTNIFGNSFNGASNAFVDASDYARLRMSGSTSMAGHGQASASARIIIADIWSISNAILAGQTGMATVQLLIHGSADASRGQVLWQLDAYTGSGGITTNIFHQLYQLTAAGSEFCTTQCYGLFAFDIPFVWGTPFDIRIDWIGRADTSLAPGQTGLASYDLANTLYWGGITNTSANGVSVTEYAFNSDSGFDWRASGIPSNSIPEPVSLALLGLGLAAIVGIRLNADG